MEYVYKTRGTCSTNIELDTENGIVKETAFWGGCNGNLQDISHLVTGVPTSEVIIRLKGIRYRTRSIPCSDQLCRALHETGF